MKISHIKKTTDGNLEELIEIEYTDYRYPHSSDLIVLSLEEAIKFRTELDKKLSEIPF